MISVELAAYESGIPTGSDLSPGAVEYSSAFSFSGSTHVKARVKSGNTWSALSEATFCVGPVKENLRITEIMYHPGSTGDPSDPNKEYIELTNIGPGGINLNLVRFVNGVDFTFGEWALAEGDYVLVVKDLAVLADGLLDDMDDPRHFLRGHVHLVRLELCLLFRRGDANREADEGKQNKRYPGLHILNH